MGIEDHPKSVDWKNSVLSGLWSEAVLPSDLLHNAPRVEVFSEEEAEQARQDSVDLLEEEREMALIRSTIYQQDLRR